MYDFHRFTDYSSVVQEEDLVINQIFFVSYFFLLAVFYANLKNLHQVILIELGTWEGFRLLNDHQSDCFLFEVEKH